MKDAGYKMTSSVNDTYRVYSNNVSTKWVNDGKITIDDNIMKWVEDSKALYDAKETSSAELWSDDWKKGFYPEGKVFCYFEPTWLVNFSMAADWLKFDMGQVYVMIAFSIFPVIIVYLFLSRYIVQGVAVGSVKG